MQVKVNPVLGSRDTLEYLEVLSEAPTENLMLAQCGVFVEVLWQKHSLNIYMMTQIFIFNFIFFMIYIVFHLESYTYTILLHVLSTLMILFEFREMCLNSFSYFS